MVKLNIVKTLETKVVNVRVKHIRPKYENLKEWMDDSSNVYIGRAGIVFIDNERFPKKPSIFMNPYKKTKNETVEEILEKYEKYIREKIENDENILNELKKLKYKNLGCWCYPNRCHGEILLKLINEYKL